MKIDRAVWVARVLVVAGLLLGGVALYLWLGVAPMLAYAGAVMVIAGLVVLSAVTEVRP